MSSSRESGVRFSCCFEEEEDEEVVGSVTIMFLRFCWRTRMSSWSLRAPLLFIAPMKRVLDMKDSSIRWARPDVMNCRSGRPR